MDDCLFCNIISGAIPSHKVYEDDQTYAFLDIAPQVKNHVLVVPKTHVKDLVQAEALTDGQLAACLRTCAKVAENLGMNDSGYRVSTNCGEHGCQSVPHLHFHVLGGEQLSGKMG